jgi:hypothetical protein
VGEIEILVPVAATRVHERSLAPRVDNLAGRRVGLLSNRKANAGLLLDVLAEELTRLVGAVELMSEAKGAASAAPAEVMGRLVRCDAVVLAIAD